MNETPLRLAIIVHGETQHVIAFFNDFVNRSWEAVPITHSI